MRVRQTLILCTACGRQWYDYYGKGMKQFDDHARLWDCFGRPVFRD